MKYILTLLIVLSTCSLQAQCVFEINEIDDFEGFRRLTTESRGVITKLGGDHMYISFTKNGDSYFVDLEMWLQLSTYSVIEGNEVYFKLENGEIIKAPSTSTVISSISTLTDSSDADIRYSLTREQVEQFTESPIVQIRIHFRNSYKDIDIKSKRRGGFSMVLARCLLNEE